MKNRKILGILLVSLFSLLLVSGSTAMASNNDTKAACCPQPGSKATQTDTKCTQSSAACCPTAKGGQAKCDPCPTDPACCPEPTSGTACCPEQDKADKACCPQAAPACCPSDTKSGEKGDSSI